MHYRPAELKPIGGRPEDFLATDEQFAVCNDILRRSALNEWDDLMARARGRYFKREGTDDTVIHRMRERTPKTLQDVKWLNHESRAEDSGYSSWHSSFSEKDLGYSDQNNVNPGPSGGSGIFGARFMAGQGNDDPGPSDGYAELQRSLDEEAAWMADQEGNPYTC